MWLRLVLSPGHARSGLRRRREPRLLAQPSGVWSQGVSPPAFYLRLLPSGWGADSRGAPGRPATPAPSEPGASRGDSPPRVLSFFLVSRPVPLHKAPFASCMTIPLALKTLGEEVTNRRSSSPFPTERMTRTSCDHAGTWRPGDLCKLQAQ
ncbi:uncharacterized protein LOC144578450 [Callithrix jacchus]